MRIRKVWFDLTSVLIGIIFLASAAAVYLGLVGGADIPPAWRIVATSFFVILGLAFSFMSFHIGRTYQRIHEENPREI